MTKRLLKPVIAISIAGVCIAGLGIYTKVLPLYYTGLVLASPLLLVYLPFLIIALAARITQPLWISFYILIARRHGTPFQPGDLVRVLRGPHKDKVLPVYDVWAERYQIRLELSAKEKMDFTDVFSFLSVQRVKQK